MPSFTEAQQKIPFGRVNHNKYMVTDNVAYIGWFTIHYNITERPCYNHVAVYIQLMYHNEVIMCYNEVAVYIQLMYHNEVIMCYNEVAVYIQLMYHYHNEVIMCYNEVAGYIPLILYLCY